MSDTPDRTLGNSTNVERESSEGSPAKRAVQKVASEPVVAAKKKTRLSGPRMREFVHEKFNYTAFQQAVDNDDRLTDAEKRVWKKIFDPNRHVSSAAQRIQKFFRRHVEHPTIENLEGQPINAVWADVWREVQEHYKDNIAAYEEKMISDAEKKRARKNAGLTVLDLHISLDQRLDDLCHFMNSNIPNEKKGKLCKAINEVLERKDGLMLAPDNMDKRGRFLAFHIENKFSENPFPSFLAALKEKMGEDYPLDAYTNHIEHVVTPRDPNTLYPRMLPPLQHMKTDIPNAVAIQGSSPRVVVTNYVLALPEDEEKRAILRHEAYHIMEPMMEGTDPDLYVIQDKILNSITLNAVSRTHEFGADRLAGVLGDGYVAVGALSGVVEKNTEPMALMIGEKRTKTQEVSKNVLQHAIGVGFRLQPQKFIEHTFQEGKEGAALVPSGTPTILKTVGKEVLLKAAKIGESVLHKQLDDYSQKPPTDYTKVKKRWFNTDTHPPMSERAEKLQDQAWQTNVERKSGSILGL